MSERLTRAERNRQSIETAQGQGILVLRRLVGEVLRLVVGEDVPRTPGVCESARQGVPDHRRTPACRAMRLLAAFFRLRPEQVLAVEAVLCLALARAVVSHVPVGRWRGVLHPPVHHARSATRRRALGWAAGRMVRRVARRLPFEAQCLPRTMAAQWMLLRRSVPSRVVFGARRAAPDRPNHYHAWLTVDGEPVVGGRQAETYTPLPFFPRSAPAQETGCEARS